MFFLIQYNRSKGKIITIEDYLSQKKAQKERLRLELEQNRKSENHEIVLLEASSKKQLHNTHSRYFNSHSKIISSFLKLHADSLHLTKT